MKLNVSLFCHGALLDTLTAYSLKNKVPLQLPAIGYMFSFFTSSVEVEVLSGIHKSSACGIVPTLPPCLIRPYLVNPKLPQRLCYVCLELGVEDTSSVGSVCETEPDSLLLS